MSVKISDRHCLYSFACPRGYHMNDMIRHKLMTFLFSFGSLPVLCEGVVVFDLEVKCRQLNLLKNTDFFFIDKVGLFSDIVTN